MLLSCLLVAATKKTPTYIANRFLDEFAIFLTFFHFCKTKTIAHINDLLYLWRRRCQNNMFRTMQLSMHESNSRRSRDYLWVSVCIKLKSAQPQTDEQDSSETRRLRYAWVPAPIKSSLTARSHGLESESKIWVQIMNTTVLGSGYNSRGNGTARFDAGSNLIWGVPKSWACSWISITLLAQPPHTYRPL